MIAMKFYHFIEFSIEFSYELLFLGRLPNHQDSHATPYEPIYIRAGGCFSCL